MGRLIALKAFTAPSKQAQAFTVWYLDRVYARSTLRAPKVVKKTRGVKHGANNTDPKRCSLRIEFCLGE